MSSDLSSFLRVANPLQKAHGRSSLASRGNLAIATLVEPIEIEPEGAAQHRAVPVRRSRFYLWLTLVCAGVAIGGFMGTYWLQLPAGTFRGPPLLHIHGFLCTAWALFLISQASLVTRGKIRSHRDWGLLGISLASVLTVVAIAVAVTAMNDRVGEYGDRARSFLIVPFSAIGLYAGFTAAAIANVKRPEWHKRFMIIGTSCLIQAALARVFFLAATGGGPGMRPGVLPPPPVSIAAMPAFLLELILVAGMIRDWKVQRKVHPAWIIGVVVITSLELMRPAIASSGAWLSFASWAGGVAG
jgi:hypothetical protein